MVPWLADVVHDVSVEEFEALVHSLGEHAVDYLGKDNLRSLVVFGDPVGTAYIEICLQENTWEAQSQAIDTMIELRRMFLDELSIEYRFVEEDDLSRTAAERSSYAYA